MEAKIVKCPTCGHETQVRKIVRRKFCIKCGTLMKEVAE